jgi:hypothetical protein
LRKDSQISFYIFVIMIVIIQHYCIFILNSSGAPHHNSTPNLLKLKILLYNEHVLKSLVRMLLNRYQWGRAGYPVFLKLLFLDIQV